MEASLVPFLVFTVLLQAGDKLLLCSDSLWEVMCDSDIQQIMSIPLVDSSQVVETLIQAALANGSSDKMSVIVAFVFS